MCNIKAYKPPHAAIQHVANGSGVLTLVLYALPPKITANKGCPISWPLAVSHCESLTPRYPPDYRCILPPLALVTVAGSSVQDGHGHLDATGLCRRHAFEGRRMKQMAEVCKAHDKSCALLWAMQRS